MLIVYGLLTSEKIPYMEHLGKGWQVRFVLTSRLTNTSGVRLAIESLSYIKQEISPLVVWSDILSKLSDPPTNPGQDLYLIKIPNSSHPSEKDHHLPHLFFSWSRSHPRFSILPQGMTRIETHQAAGSLSNKVSLGRIFNARLGVAAGEAKPNNAKSFVG